MRIGIDVHAVERDGSGNCTYMRGLLQGLAAVDANNEYLLYGTDLRHPYYETLRQLGRFQIRPLWPRFAPLRILMALGVRSFLDRLDVLHVQYAGPPFLHGRLVSTIHDTGFIEAPESFSRFERAWMPWLIGITARRAARVLTVSEFSCRQVSAWARVSAERVCVTYDGVAAQFTPVPGGGARDALLRRYGIQQPFLLSLGRLNPRKNLIRLIEAFERSAVVGPQLVIAGPADYQSNALMKRIEASPCRAAIRCVGFIPDADLPAVLSAAVALIYPSLFEGFGLPPLEAAACGTPVIASNVAALPEILGNAAILLDPTDTNAFAAAIRRVLCDADLRRELRQRGLDRAAQFSWEAVARRVMAAYESIGGPLNTDPSRPSRAQGGVSD